jgi:hypothetical protein
VTGGVLGVEPGAVSRGSIPGRLPPHILRQQIQDQAYQPSGIHTVYCTHW